MRGNYVTDSQALRTNWRSGRTARIHVRTHRDKTQDEGENIQRSGCNKCRNKNILKKHKVEAKDMRQTKQGSGATLISQSLGCNLDKNDRHLRTDCKIFSWESNDRDKTRSNLLNTKDSEDTTTRLMMTILRRYAKLLSKIKLFFSARKYPIRKCNSTSLNTESAIAQITS